ncbi:hypothetical protein BC937DRAFT_92153, partial [Endogone sp. FLAS-F59071]
FFLIVSDDSVEYWNEDSESSTAKQNAGGSVFGYIQSIHMPNIPIPNISNMLGWGWSKNQDKSNSLPTIELVFHVHLPQKIHGYEPAVLGSIPELGKWELSSNTVWLHPVGKTYWVSPPVKISCNRQDVYYKYALIDNKRKVIFEAFLPRDNRKLPLTQTFRFDVWQRNSRFSVDDNFLNREFAFVQAIIRSLSLADSMNYGRFLEVNESALKEAIFMYQCLLDQQEIRTRAATTLDKITEAALNSKHVTQSLFVVVLLGYYLSFPNNSQIEGGHHWHHRHNATATLLIKFPNRFPSGRLLESLQHFRYDMLPSRTEGLVEKAVCALVQHNSTDSFEWMTLFGNSFDTKWLDSVKSLQLPEASSKKLVDSIQKHVIPNLDSMNHESRVLALKALIGIASSQNILVLLCEIPIFWEIIFNQQETFQNFTDRLREILLNNSPKGLLNLHRQVPKPLCPVFDLQYRHLLRFIIGSKNFQWNQSEIEALMSRTKDNTNQQSTANEDLIHALISMPAEVDDFSNLLGSVVNSQSPLLRDLLPGLLQDFWFPLRNLNTHLTKPYLEEVQKNTERWYRETISTVRLDARAVYNIFVKLLEIMPREKVQGWSVDGVVKIANAEVDKCTEEQILIVALQIWNIKVDKKCPKIILKLYEDQAINSLQRFFDKLITRRQATSVVVHHREGGDDGLLDRLAWICAWKAGDNNLKVPNKLCEKLVSYMITRAELLATQGQIEEAVFRQMHDIQFWTTILTLKGVVENINKALQPVRMRIVLLKKLIARREITFGHLTEIFHFSDSRLLEYLNCTQEDVITQETLTELRRSQAHYTHKLQILENFVERFGRFAKCPDCDYILNEFIKPRRNNMAALTVANVHSPGHWGQHQNVLRVAESVEKLFESKTFRNIISGALSETMRIEGVDVMANIVEQALKEFRLRCVRYATGWEQLSYTDERPMWQNIDSGEANSEIQRELDMMSQTTAVKISGLKELVRSLEGMIILDKGVAQLQDILKLKNMNMFHPENESENVAKQPHLVDSLGVWIKGQLEIISAGCSLKDIFEYTDYYNQNLSQLITDDTCNLTKAILQAEDMFNFFKEIENEDLKDWVNAVADQSDDGCIQETTQVTSLEEVRRELRDFLSLKQPDTMQLLVELNELVGRNTHLASKLRICHESLYSLRQIHKAIQRGIFEINFRSGGICEVHLKYSARDGIEVSCTLPDLLDLRGRGLLLVDSATKFGEFPAPTSADNEESVMPYVNEFVLLVDLVGELLTVGAQLSGLGHFDYQACTIKVRSSNGMADQLNKLKRELAEWKTILEQCRGKNHLLSYFRGCDLVFFKDYFSGHATASPNIRSTCATLVRFYNQDAVLEPEGADINEPGLTASQILDTIGERLTKIFEPFSRSIPRTILMRSRQTVVSDVVIPRRLFVAVCNHRSLVPNVIMSLYVNDQHVPEPSQLLMCTSSTTEEELELILKRCVWAFRQDKQLRMSRNRLFCIAGVQDLSFETQSTLVRKIREVQSLGTEYKFQLSLVCVREAGGHHNLLDEFENFVHITSGLDAATMKLVVQNITANTIEVVTSDLSGQGKTYYIQNAALDAGFKLRTLLIGDAIDRKEIIRQLQNPPLEPDEYLHLLVGKSANPPEIDIFLFELLILRFIFAGPEAACLSHSQRVFIELETTVDSGDYHGRVGCSLMNELPFTAHHKYRYLEFDINKLVVHPEAGSPIQIVCRYLRALKDTTIDAVDISLDDPALPAAECVQLLAAHLATENFTQLSFRLMHTFVCVFANQLKHLSESTFFKVSTLEFTGSPIHNLRTLLVTALLNVSRDFAVRSISNDEGTAANYIERMNTMTKWSDLKHLLVFFQSQDPNCICALYRNPQNVPHNVKMLLQSQSLSGITADIGTFSARQAMSFQMLDYSRISMKELLDELEKIARRTHDIDENKKRKYPPYALSTDNLLKMALILLRTRVKVPVVLCGEAGCGKTSLIGFLANVAEVDFTVLDLHAGVSKERIVEFIENAEERASHGEVWVFLDEVNTCGHIRMLTSLICDRLIMGRKIHDNIRLLAACNPYRLRRNITNDAGLRTRYQEQSQLVYQVHPLTEALIDVIWEYGTLEENDERAYINIMANEFKPMKQNGSEPTLAPPEISSLFAELLFESQRFIRSVEDVYSVSLRDVKRAIRFANFFERELKSSVRKSQSKTPIHSKNCTAAKCSEYPPNRDKFGDVRAIILALSIAYQGRLCEQNDRLKYRQMISDVFLRKHHMILSSDDFIRIVSADQLDLLHRMRIPEFTALNEALLENVHSMVACILTRTPLFLIGSPGASKSLAIKIVKENLRGLDSADPYFQSHPQVYIIPHQGSSSSTSDGIIKVFKKAERYQEKSNTDKFPSRAVVLLDEVGLAETSPFNPLKVLHALLEPQGSDACPSVAVVGISNWRLDASKMSRAIRIQRPIQDIHDLVQTTKGLMIMSLSDQILSTLARAYHNYQQSQHIANFHGLRDYYALVKSLRGELTPSLVQGAVARNFSGGDQRPEILCDKFFPPSIFRKFVENSKFPQALDCIRASLEDPDARHLMAIGDSDLTIDILANAFSDESRRRKSPQVIYGSQFPADKDSSDYAYGVLNKILLCVEEGRPVILKDLDIIYGSLYDLWNKNYTSVGSGSDQKNFCRVALGEFANPMCPVHPDFRCIVVMDQSAVEQADPPLLNRFEKQRIGWESLLNEENSIIVKELATWAIKISAFGKTFGLYDMFIGYCGDNTLRCLVLRHSNWGKIQDRAKVIEKCKQSLIEIACSEGIVRSTRSPLAVENPEEAAYWYNYYFSHQRHSCLKSFFNWLYSDQIPPGDFGNVIIRTFSNINTDIHAYLGKLPWGDVTVEKLEQFQSETKLQSHIRRFWLESTDSLLILQCDPATSNPGCVKLARFYIDFHRKEYLAQIRGTSLGETKKSACIMMHIHRDVGVELPMSRNQFDFLCDWYQVLIEDLTSRKQPLTSLLDGSVYEIIHGHQQTDQQSTDITPAILQPSVYRFSDILEQELQWALLCIRYDLNTESLDRLSWIMETLPACQPLVNFLQRRIEALLKEHETPDWQYRVACDRQLLKLSNSFSRALEKHIRHVVRAPLAKFIYSLEKKSALFALFSIKDEEYENNPLFQLWENIFNDDHLFKVEEIEPQPNGYRLTSRLHMLHFPFSRYFSETIDGFKQMYLENFQHQEGFLQWVTSFVPLLEHRAFMEYGRLYLADFLTMALQMNTSAHIEVLAKLIIQELNGRADNPIIFHIHWWKNEEKIMTQLRIIQFCVRNLDCDLEALRRIADDANFNLAPFAARLILSNLNEAIDKDNWQNNANILLALCAKIPEYNACPAWRLLKFVLELCSTLVFPRNLPLDGVLELVVNIQNADLTNAYLQRFVADVLTYFEQLDNNDEIRESNEKLKCQRSFFVQCVDIVSTNPNIISRESLANMGILKKIFSAKPLPHLASLIQKIFIEQNLGSPDLFLHIIGLPLKLNATNGLSTEMQVVKKCLDEAGLESQLAVICCDVIYERFLTSTSVSTLGQLFTNAFEILQNFHEPLRYICAVALFKALFSKLALQFGRGVMNSNSHEVENVNYHLAENSDLIHHIIVYFLQSLRDQFGYSTAELREQCGLFQHVLPWVGNGYVDWNQINYSNQGFDPYAFISQTRQTYQAFSRLQMAADDSAIIQLLPLHDFNSKFGFFGAAVNVLFIPFSVQWDKGQTRLATWLAETQRVTGTARQFIERILDRHSALLPEAADNPVVIMRHSVIAHCIVLHASLEPGCSPLATYLFGPEQVSRDYIVTCPLDEVSAVLNVLISANGFSRRYQCPCGFMYVIGNCGLPMVQSTCPSCGQIIGGQEHKVTGGSQMLDNNVVQGPLIRNDLVGYVAQTPASLSSPHYTQSTLTPTAYRVLHLLIHAIFAFSPSAIAAAIPDQNPQQYCLDHIRNDWDVLKEILVCDDDMVHLMLHAILLRMQRYQSEHTAALSTVTERETWETQFMNNCVAPVVSNLRESIADYRLKLARVQQDGYRLENELMETLDLANDLQQQQQLHSLTLWRYAGRPISDETFIRELRGVYGPDPEKHRQFPFLEKFFNHYKNLRLLRHLLPLVEFSQELRSRLGHRIKREDARKMTFEKFLEEEREKSEPHLYGRLELLFSMFTEAWNSIRHLVKNFACETLPPMEPMSENMTVVFAIYEPKDESVYLHVALETLARYQNEFLEDIGAMDVSTCPPLVFLQPTELIPSEPAYADLPQQVQRRTAFTSVRLQDLRDTQVITDTDECLNSRSNPELFMNFQRKPEYGRGEVIEFDIEEIESYLARTLVFNKVHIQVEMDKFPYRGELFVEHMNITGNIDDIIPQQPIINGLAMVISNDPNICELASDLLADLEIVFCYLERTLGKQGVDGNMLVMDYCHQWLNRSTMTGATAWNRITSTSNTAIQSSLSVLNAELFQKTALGQLHLMHIVAMYELIEDIVSPVLLERVPERYKLKLDDGDGIEENIIKAAESVSPGRLLVTLKRFVIRYLTGTSDISPDDPIVGRWEGLLSEEEDIIAELPDTLLIGHIFEAYHLLKGRELTQHELVQEQQPVTEVLSPDEQESLDLTMALSMSLQQQAEDQHEQNRETHTKDVTYTYFADYSNDDDDESDDDFVDAEEFLDEESSDGEQEEEDSGADSDSTYSKPTRTLDKGKGRAVDF